MDDLLTMQEAADLCGVNRRTMLRWAKAGAFPCQRTVGGQHRVWREDLTRFLAHQERAATDEGAPPTRVLVVDDEESVTRAVVAVVGRLLPEARVDVARDGFQAGAMVAMHRPDLVLLDVVMPGLDGVAVVRWIRTQPTLAGTRIVVVSGHVEDHQRDELETLGVDRILAKPFTAGALASILQARAAAP